MNCQEAAAEAEHGRPWQRAEDREVGPEEGVWKGSVERTLKDVRRWGGGGGVKTSLISAFASGVARRNLVVKQEKRYQNPWERSFFFFSFLSFFLFRAAPEACGSSQARD